MSKAVSSPVKQFPIPELVNTRKAAEILGRSPSHSEAMAMRGSRPQLDRNRGQG